MILNYCLMNAVSFYAFIWRGLVGLAGGSAAVLAMFALFCRSPLGVLGESLIFNTGIQGQKSLRQGSLTV